MFSYLFGCNFFGAHVGVATAVHISILLLAFGLVFISLYKHKKYSFRFVIIFFSIFVILFEILVMFGAFTFSQCTHIDSKKYENVVIPEIHL